MEFDEECQAFWGDGGEDGEKPSKTTIQKVVRKILKSSSHLSNHLPTGTATAFQILSPILTHEGQCATTTSQTLTLCLLGLCGLSCFILSFTDSCRDESGKVHHGFVTFRGLWVIDGTFMISPEESAQYKLKMIDFFHAVMSVAVFVAVALFDHNVFNCFYPKPSEEDEERLEMLPIKIGVISSLFFLIFPTTRRGIGFPLSKQ